MATSKIKENIVSVAGKLFYEKGFQATGINQIVETAGVSKAGLYLNFRSKDEILTEYLVTNSKCWFEGFQKYINNNSKGHDNIIALFTYRLESAVENDFKGCAFIRIGYELPALEERSLLVIQQHASVIKKFIKDELHFTSSSKKSLADELVEQIYNLYEGCGVQSTIFRSADAITAAIAIVKKLLQ